MQHIAYTEKPHTNRYDFKNIVAVLPLLMEFKGRAIFAIVCLVLSKLSNVGIPLILKELVDYLDQQDKAILVLPIVLLVAYGLLRLGSSLFNELRDVVFAKVRYRAMRRLSTKVLNHLHQLSLRYHLERQTGAISRDLDRGTRSVSSIMNYMVFSILPTFAEFLLVALILLSQYNIEFAVVTFVTVSIYVSFTFKMTEWRMDYRIKMNKLDSKGNTQAIDSLINYETVKYFGNESFELSRYDQTLEEWEDYAVKSQVSMSALNFGQGAIIAIGVTLIMILATQGVVDGVMTIGDLVLVNAFLLQLFLPLGFLGIVYRQIKYAFADMDSMMILLNQKPEIMDSVNAKALIINEGRVEFRQVDFGYQKERQILKKISFSIEPGQKVAVVGASGGGKSTLARLLYRFYDCWQGQVLIDQQSVYEVTQQSLREAIGIVPQDTVLFNDTIYYNLLYAKPGANKEDIISAAKMAHIHEFITSLPDGYDTLVGERGLKLSGGEKQRMAIARAIIKKPKILVFDEATSSLDSKTEQAIQATLKEIAKDHTTLVIAHRLSTIVDANIIIVIDHGQIVESGTHDQLIAKQSHYYQMWEIQQKKKQVLE